MADPLVVMAMRQYKADLLAREAQQMRQMAQRWLQVEQALEPQIAALTMEMAEARAAGMTLTDAKTRQLKRYKALLVQAQDEIRKYARYAQGEITAGQQIMARLGVTQAEQLMLLSDPAGVGVSFRRLPVDEVQYMVGMAGDGKPLGELLKARMVVDAAGLPMPGVWDNLTRTLVDGTALGWNPTKTARLMRDNLSGGLQKALVIARTEQLRVYREASRATYAESGVVQGHVRVCAHDGRVCGACLADDGHVYPVNVAIPDHPSGRCSSVPWLKGMEAPKWTQGEEWLKLQDEEKQRSILGGHYEGWKAGDFGLKDMLERTKHKVWGPGLQVRPLKDLR